MGGIDERTRDRALREARVRYPDRVFDDENDGSSLLNIGLLFRDLMRKMEHSWMCSNIRLSFDPGNEVTFETYTGRGPRRRRNRRSWKLISDLRGSDLKFYFSRPSFLDREEMSPLPRFAILVIDSSSHEWKEGLTYTCLARLLGVRYVLVAVNKLDGNQGDESLFRRIEDQTKSRMNEFECRSGRDLVFCRCIPVCAKSGWNIVARPRNGVSWWDGPTLIEALQSLPQPRPLKTYPLRFPVEEVGFVSGLGLVVSGRVASGILPMRRKLIVAPSNQEFVSRSLESECVPVEEAFPSSSLVAMVVRGKREEKTERETLRSWFELGSVVGDVEDPPLVAEQFEAIVCLGPAVAGVTFRIGAEFGMEINGARDVPVKIISILSRVSVETGEEVAMELPQLECLHPGEAGHVLLHPHRPVIVEEIGGPLSYLSRFSLNSCCGDRSNSDVLPSRQVASGLVTSVTKKDDPRTLGLEEGNRIAFADTFEHLLQPILVGQKAMWSFGCFLVILL